MKIIEQIKDEYAREEGYDDWNELIYCEDDPDAVDGMNNIVAKRFAKEVAREALKNVAFNLCMIPVNRMCDCGNTYSDWYVDKQSILDEKNIPEL